MHVAPPPPELFNNETQHDEHRGLTRLVAYQDYQSISCVREWRPRSLERAVEPE